MTTLIYLAITTLVVTTLAITTLVVTTRLTARLIIGILTIAALTLTIVIPIPWGSIIARTLVAVIATAWRIIPLISSPALPSWRPATAIIPIIPTATVVTAARRPAGAIPLALLPIPVIVTTIVIIVIFKGLLDGVANLAKDIAIVAICVVQIGFAIEFIQFILQFGLNHVDHALIFTFEGIAQILNQIVNPAFAIARKLQAKINGNTPHGPFCLKCKRFRPISFFNAFSLPPVHISKLLGFSQHLLNIVFRQIRRFLHRNALLTAGGFIHGRHLQNPVGINIKRHLHLGNTTRSGRNTHQLKATQGFIIHTHFPFALEHVNFHNGLIIFRGGKHIGAPHRNSGVAGNHLFHHAANGL